MSSKELAKPTDMWPSDFPEALSDELDAVSANVPNSKGGYIDSVRKARWEADYAIMGRFSSGKTDGAIVDDSDLPIRMGNRFVAVRKFTTGGQPVMGSKMMVVSCVLRDTLPKFMKHLPTSTSAKLLEAKAPLVENIFSSHLRCLIMVAVGCDVYPPGIKGFSPGKIQRELQKIKDKTSQSD